MAAMEPLSREIHSVGIQYRFTKKMIKSLVGTMNARAMKLSRYSILSKMDEDEYLLVNASTGTVDVIDFEVYDLMIKKGEEGISRIESENKELFNKLVERGHLTDKSDEEETESIQQFRPWCDILYETKSKRVANIIITTYDCNLRCVYCFQRPLTQAMKKRQTLNEKLVDLVFGTVTKMDKNAANMPLELYGGEPLMLENWSLVEYILEKGNDMGFKFFLTTNGVTLKEYAPLLNRYDNVLYARVTLDGVKEVHDKRRVKLDGTGTFDDIIDGVDALLKKNIRVALKVVIDAGNIDHLPELFEFIISKNWHKNPLMGFGMSSIVETGCPTDSKMLPESVILPKILGILAQKELYLKNFEYAPTGASHVRNMLSGVRSAPWVYGCNFFMSGLVFDPLGDLYSCVRMASNRKLRIGRYSPVLKMFRGKNELFRKRHVFNMAKCKECKYALICGGGCMYEAWLSNKSFYEPRCPDYESLFNYWAPFAYKQIRAKNSAR
jgi:uncharacterized protein